MHFYLPKLWKPTIFSGIIRYGDLADTVLLLLLPQLYIFCSPRPSVWHMWSIYTRTSCTFDEYNDDHTEFDRTASKQPALSRRPYRYVYIFLAMSSLPVMIPVFGWAHRTKGQWTTFFGFLVLVTVRRYDIGKGTTLFRSIVCQYYTMTSSFQCEQHI